MPSLLTSAEPSKKIMILPSPCSYKKKKMTVNVARPNNAIVTTKRHPNHQGLDRRKQALR
jgi:hypothetical protein